MYEIILLNGKYHCSCRYQDGTDYWTEDDLEVAVKKMKGAAKAWNGMKIKRKDIRIFQAVPRQTVEYDYVPIK